MDISKITQAISQRNLIFNQTGWAALRQRIQLLYNKEQLKKRSQRSSESKKKTDIDYQKLIKVMIKAPASIAESAITPGLNKTLCVINRQTIPFSIHLIKHDSHDVKLKCIIKLLETKLKQDHQYQLIAQNNRTLENNM